MSREPLPKRPPQLIEKVVARRKSRLARQIAMLMGIDFPASVKVGDDFRLYHRGRGTVVHPATRFGDRCRVFHNVTIGRSDPWVPEADSELDGFVFEDDVWVCAGAVVLAKKGTLTVGRGTVVAANAVLTQSTGEWEVWAGNPARRVLSR